MKKKIKKTVFSDKDLENLPLTYRTMDVEKTKDVGELYIDTIFSKSIKHYSNNYMVYVSYKPISNFLLDETEK